MILYITKKVKHRRYYEFRINIHLVIIAFFYLIGIKMSTGAYKLIFSYRVQRYETLNDNFLYETMSILNVQII